MSTLSGVVCIENVSGCCSTTESDTDLVVEYEEHQVTSSHGEAEERSLSDSNTVNQDQDSFSILEGDSLLEAEVPQLDMPPLFVHITCSINMKSCHGSVPIQTLPTCLGEFLFPASLIMKYYLVGKLMFIPVMRLQVRLFPAWSMQRSYSLWI